jgi:hypothetical protein
MNLQSASLRRTARLFSASLLFLLCHGAMAFGSTYDPATGVLTADTVDLGGARFTSMQVKVNGIVSGPTGTFQNGLDTSYDTVSGQLTVPVVDVGNIRYYNLVGTVASLVSPGQVSGADTFDGNQLAIPYVQVGPAGSVYADVVVTLRDIVRVDGGMPGTARDMYDPATAQLTIGAVQFGGIIYTNVVVTIASVVSVGPFNPPPRLGPSPWGYFCMDCQIGSVQLVNTLGVPLNISNITIDDPNFAQTSDCPATLAPGQSCAVFVYRVGAGAARQASLIITDDGPDSPQSVPLYSQCPHGCS